MNTKFDYGQPVVIYKDGQLSFGVIVEITQIKNKNGENTVYNVRSFLGDGANGYMSDLCEESEISNIGTYLAVPDDFVKKLPSFKEMRAAAEKIGRLGDLDAEEPKPEPTKAAEPKPEKPSGDPVPAREPIPEDVPF